MFEFELPEKFRRYVPLLAWLVTVLVFLAVPLKIISLGYLPGDDALRHAAKAVSGKTWPEILVVGDSYKIDQSLGWHAILGWVHHLMGWDAEALVIFSVAGLFLMVNCAMLPWLKRPEAWLVSVLTAMMVSDLSQRFLLGRPFILTITVLMTVLFAVQHKKPGGWMLAMMTVLITACTYIHGVWYLWLLPIAAIFFAGKFRWSFLLAGAWVLGTGFSMLLSGHPADYLGHALHMALNGVGGHLTNRTEVTELQPSGGDILAVMVMGAVMALRLWNKPAAPSFTKNPAFWLMLGCWILGFRIGRFWEDWGWPSLMVLIAMEVELLMVAKLAEDSLRRLFVVLILAAATFACVTSDQNSRYTQTLTTQFLSEKEHPELAGWMPEKGGILYSADMTIFYQTFFKNPHGDWRYQLGFEPALMPAEDFETYHKILWNGGDVKAYAPWIEKMKPADRLMVRGNTSQRPSIPQLEWYYGVSGVWIGRLPRTTP
ncbi:MAG TPA: hypothetical protein VG347_04935 [Verrucomicrobiae bacterium]|nr:hypothetical protein [Verrucomicrobiae bacterium]